MLSSIKTLLDCTNRPKQNGTAAEGEKANAVPDEQILLAVARTRTLEIRPRSRHDEEAVERAASESDPPDLVEPALDKRVWRCIQCISTHPAYLVHKLTALHKLTPISLDASVTRVM